MHATISQPTLTPWLRGRKRIMAKLAVDDWSTVEKYLAEGAPIAKILGSWLTLDCLLDAWLADRLTGRLTGRLAGPQDGAGEEE
jgi:hypothetical protein